MVDRVEKEGHKERDVEQIVRYLTSTFNKAKSPFGRASRSNETGMNRAYQIESEFAYLINEIVQGPPCMVQKGITECNEFIDTVITEGNQLSNKSDNSDL